MYLRPNTPRRRRAPLVTGISERSRTVVKGLTVIHDDAVDEQQAVSMPEIIAKAAQSVSKWARRRPRAGFCETHEQEHQAIEAPQARNPSRDRRSRSGGQS